MRLNIERKLLREGKMLIAGVDEAGRGALAGPVVAAAVLFDEEILKRKKILFGDEVKDSKLLSYQKRKKLFHKIVGLGIVNVAEVSPDLIDKMNIFQASLLAMKNATLGLPLEPEVLLIDGPHKIDLEIEQIPLIHGDRFCFTISCASIVAKVYRDRMMEEIDEFYPRYRFSLHKGYGTLLHRKLIKKYGPSPIHRLSFSPCS